MPALFTDTAFAYETVRTLGYAGDGGADIGEVLTTCAGIVDGDWGSWYEGWHALAVRVEELGDQACAAGERESARCAYLRASNYHRTADFFLRDRDDPYRDPRAAASFDRSVECFRAALQLSEVDWSPLAVPFQGHELSGYCLAAPASGPRPTLIVHGGFDSTVEELFFVAGAAALRRGYHCVLVEGPGQGAALRRHGLVFRPDWESVITAVVDRVLGRRGVDAERLVLLGMSLGGLLAPRAAAFERRLAACVAFDGVLDLNHAVPVPADVPDPAAHLDRLMADRARLPGQLRWVLSNARWVFGVRTGRELLDVLVQYDLTHVAGRITCPTLVCEAEDDISCAGQPRALYDTLTCPRDLVPFTRAEGAGEHCQAGALTLFHQRMFTWLARVLDLVAAPVTAGPCVPPG